MELSFSSLPKKFGILEACVTSFQFHLICSTAVCSISINLQFYFTAYLVLYTVNNAASVRVIRFGGIYIAFFLDDALARDPWTLASLIYLWREAQSKHPNGGGILLFCIAPRVYGHTSVYGHA